MKKPIVYLIFILSCLVNAALADVLIVSDIDDTVKQTNSSGKLAKVYHFLKNKPYTHTRDILNQTVQYHESKGEKVTVVYVSAAYKFMFNAQKFIKKSNLPAGESILRKLSSGDTFTFKFLTIKRLIEKARAENPETKILLFGDNSEHDHDVYWQIKQSVAPDAYAFIRDVATWARFFNEELEVKKIEGLHFFFSEKELLENAFFDFMPADIKSNIYLDFNQKKLVPEYTTKTLERRLKKQRKCLQKPALDQTIRCNQAASKDAKNLIEQYYVATGALLVDLSSQ